MKAALRFCRTFLLKLCFLVLIFFAAKRLTCSVTEGFTIQKITSSLSFDPKWEVSSSLKEEELKKILGQKFTYLGKGAQCFAFVSEDDSYVLKFFKFQHLIPKPIFVFLPLPSYLDKIRKQHIEKKHYKLNRHFGSYKIAYENLKEECGLVYLHLNKTHFLHQKTILVDKLNIEHSIDMDEMEFIIQKRATLAYNRIGELMGCNDEVRAKEAISNLVKLMAVRAQKGVLDIDPNISKNFGFIGDMPVQVDLGGFVDKNSFDDPYVKKISFARQEKRMYDDFIYWLNRNYPTLSGHFDEEFKELIQNANNSKTAK